MLTISYKYCADDAALGHRLCAPHRRGGTLYFYYTIEASILYPSQILYAHTPANANHVKKITVILLKIDIDDVRNTFIFI